MIQLNQGHYAKQLRIPLNNAQFSKFHSTRQKLAWLFNTRPDILCAVNMSDQVT